MYSFVLKIMFGLGVCITPINIDFVSGNKRSMKTFSMLSEIQFFILQQMLFLMSQATPPPFLFLLF